MILLVISSVLIAALQHTKDILEYGLQYVIISFDKLSMVIFKRLPNTHPNKILT